MIGRIVDLVGALWVLSSLAVVSKFRFNGRYWRWRTITAFPDGRAPGGKIRSIGLALDYARWAWRLRRLR